MTVHGAGSYGRDVVREAHDVADALAASSDQSARPGYDMPASATGVRLTQ